jgi:hypothetical protein
VAADYYRAMTQIEQNLSLQNPSPASSPSPGELLALVDALHNGTLNEMQLEMTQALRAGILALAERSAQVT